MRGRAKTVSDALFEIAEGQQGYYTAKQATDAGYQLGSQAHHTKSGNWVSVEPYLPTGALPSIGRRATGHLYPLVA